MQTAVLQMMKNKWQCLFVPFDEHFSYIYDSNIFFENDEHCRLGSRGFSCLSFFPLLLSIGGTISVTAILSLPSKCDISHFSWRQGRRKQLMRRIVWIELNSFRRRRRKQFTTGGKEHSPYWI